MIPIRTTKEIAAMRAGGRICAQILNQVAKQVQAGVSTRDLAMIAKEALENSSATAAFLGYQGFPDVICISVNDEVVHGIPSGRKLQPGDVVGLDFGVRYQGLVTDAAVTLVVDGKMNNDIKRLVTATKEALAAGIAEIRDGARIGDVAQAIEQRLRQDNMGVVETLVGHGVGHKVHEPPEVPNFGTAGHGPVLRAGMTIALEPMATLGSKDVYLDKDGWTWRTRDQSLAAHFEHTVLVTDSGSEILTSL